MKQLLFANAFGVIVSAILILVLGQYGILDTISNGWSFMLGATLCIIFIHVGYPVYDWIKS